MSSRMGFALAAVLLLIAAALRLWNLGTLPPGLHDDEITDIRITEAIRQGRISVFYDLESLGDQGGREGLYPMLLAATTTITGNGLIDYRIPSVLANLLMLAVVYALAARLYGPLGAVAALALLAVGMWPTLLARSLGRETLLPLLVGATLLSLARALPVYYQPPPREPGTAPFAALGLLLGMGFYLHPAHFLLALGCMIFLAYMVVSSQPLSSRTLSYIGFAILVMIIVAVPYVISSIRLPELDGAGRVFGAYRATNQPLLQTLLDGLKGIFFIGDASPVRNLPGRPLVDLGSGLVIVIGLLAALNRWQRPRFLLPLVAFAVLMPVAFLRPASPDFSGFAVLLPVLALFFGLGVSTLYHILRPAVRPLLGLGLVTLLALNLIWSTHDLFSVWPAETSVRSAYHGRIAQLAHHIDRTARSLPTVVCIPSVTSLDPQPRLTDAQLLILMMHTRDKVIRYADCGSGLVLANGGEHQQVIFTAPDTLAKMHPYLRAWLRQSEFLNAADLPPDSVALMNVSNMLADTIGRFTTTAPVTYAPEAPGGSDLTLPPVSFGGNLTFLGYEQDTTDAYHPGDVVTSIVYWRVDGMLPPDVRLFTHILSDPAAIISQTDTLSVLASHLHRRDIFIQITFVPLPPSTPDGNYMISIGAYQQSDDQRLGVLSDGQERGTRLFLVDHGITVTAS
ncbi:MAG: glycosyltransferase family 39 protein [Anaerolineae bacterium]|nr:glycosyltransferase family 39 protein [Anaerolineae bacterium]